VSSWQEGDDEDLTYAEQQKKLKNMFKEKKSKKKADTGWMSDLFIGSISQASQKQCARLVSNYDECRVMHA
jgi:hypothetical protein